MFTPRVVLLHPGIFHDTFFAELTRALPVSAMISIFVLSD